MPSYKFSSKSFSIFFESKTQIAKTAHVFRFSFTDKDRLHFKPGQHVWLVLEQLPFPDPRGERRVFSIISSNKEHGFIEFLVRDSDSGFKKTMQALKKGDVAKIIGPFGSSFVIPDDNRKDITFIAGGAALAPFLGIVNSLDTHPIHHLRMIHFFGSQKGEEEIINLAKKYQEFGIEVFSHQSRFDGGLMPKDVDYQNELFFVTGPQGFVNNANDFLNSQNVPSENRYFEENYPELEGSLREEDFKENAGEKNIMLQAISAFKAHVVATDANGKIIFANPFAEEATGFKFSEMRGNTPRLWGGEMPPSFYRDLWKKKSSEKSFNGEILNRRKNGEAYMALVHISSITNARGIVVGYIGDEYDITASHDQKEILAYQNVVLEEGKRSMLNMLEDLHEEKQKLAEAQAKDEAIIFSLADGLVAVDKDGKIVLVNKAFEDILGWKGREVEGKCFTEIVTLLNEKGEPILEPERSIILALKGTTTTTITTLQYKRKDGSLFPVAITVSPIMLEGDILGAVEVFRDITKEKEVDKAKTEFVSLASHQLRTPLSTVNWYSEMLLAGDAGEVTSEQKKYLEEIYQGNQRMVELVNALLNVSRIELGIFMVEPESTDVVKLALSVIDEQKPQIDEKKLHITSTFSKNIPIILADPKLLRMVFQNLLSNAVKYTPEGGKVEISLSLHDKNNILLRLSDTGYGIPREQQDKIFTKLFRADNVREKDTEGTGLGLYIVKSIVEHSGGKIWFESPALSHVERGENKGTIFYVTLPLAGMKKQEGTKAFAS